MDMLDFAKQLDMRVTVSFGDEYDLSEAKVLPHKYETRKIEFTSISIIRLFAYCKGGNFNIHIWARWFGYFIC